MKLESTFFNHDAQAGGFFPKAHVGIDVSGFGYRQNMLIEGIRGAGKTHILRMIERNYFEGFENLRVLPVFVSLARINEHARKEPNEFRLHLYTHIVERCVETIEKYRKFINTDSGILEKAVQVICTLFGIQHETKIDRILTLIKKTSENLKFKLQFDLTSDSFRTKERKEFSNTKKDSLKVSTPPVYGSCGLDVSDTEKELIETGAEENLMFVGSRLAHRNACNFLIEFLRQVQILLNLQHTLLLLDECSEASPQSQIEIFRLFKTIRGADAALPGKDSCAFFIGSVYPRLETSYPVRERDGFSFQPGHDCSMEFLQWDETNIESYIRFFKEMTLARAQVILGHEGDFNSLQNQIFDCEDTFFTAAYCAHGIPRRYWELLKQSYDKNFGKITLSGLDVSIQEIVNGQILSIGMLNEQDLGFVDNLIRQLNGVNVWIRMKNRRSHVVKLPQNIYFSVKR